MSVLSVIRKATSEDYKRIEASAMRFCNRYSISYDPALKDDLLASVAYSTDHDAYKRYLWQKAYCRALQLPYDRRIGIGWGNVGYWLD